MSETQLSLMDVDSAARFMRHLGADEALEAGILTPMAGTRPVRLFSLEEAERFLVVHDASTVDAGGRWATINYVDPAHLATWIGDTLGDQDLADGLREIASSRKPYGFLVPDMKSLIASRIGQARQVLGISEVAAD
jgi:hypothetical protein